MKTRLTKIDFRHPSDDFRQAGLTTDGNPLGFRHRRQPAPTAARWKVDSFLLKKIKQAALATFIQNPCAPI